MSDARHIILGAFLGGLAGLLPGMHINSISSFISSDALVVAAGAFLITSIIQSMLFFSATPESVGNLPFIGRLVKKKGLFPIFYAHSLGVFIGLSFPLFFYSEGSIELASLYLKDKMWAVLSLIALILVLRSRNPLTYFIFFSLSGLVGIASFNLLRDPFTPMFSGLFSIPYLLLIRKGSIGTRLGIPSLSFKIVAASLLGVVLGYVGVLLPGVSSPSVLSTALLPVFPGGQAYVALLASTTASQYVWSFYSFEETGKARVGWIKDAIGADPSTILYGAALGFLILVPLLMLRPDPSRVKWILVAFLLSLALFQGIASLAVFLVSSALGYVVAKEDVEKTSLLGSLIVPVMLYYFIPMLPL